MSRIADFSCRREPPAARKPGSLEATRIVIAASRELRLRYEHIERLDDYRAATLLISGAVWKSYGYLQ